MKILIVGCGKVGKALANELSKEKHEIYILDSNREVVKELSTQIDCLGIVGQATSVADLKDAGAIKCELLLAMTSSDESNILSCLFARKINPNIKTIARVRNTLYANDINYIRDELGLTMVVNPEDITSREIAKILRIPSAMKVETFSKSRVQMVSFELPEDNILVGKSVAEVSKIADDPVLIAGVETKEEAIIPNGSTVLNAKNVVTVIGRSYAIAKFFEHIGIIKKPIKNVFIAGGSRIAYYLAKNLLNSGVEVTIVDINKEKCEMLAESLPEANIVCGDATEANFMVSEGIENADAFVALTGVDEENLMLSLYAKTSSNLTVVTKVNHIAYDEIIAKLDLGALVSPKQILAEQIIRYVRGYNNAIASANITTLYRILNNKAEVLSFKIFKDSAVTNKPLKDLKLKKELLVCTIVRNDEVIIPSGNDSILLGDTVLIATTNLGLDDIEGISA